VFIAETLEAFKSPISKLRKRNKRKKIIAALTITIRKYNMYPWDFNL